MESNIKEIIEEFMESALAQWVLLFENMVESEDGAPHYSQYMEVNSVSQSARDRYLRLTNGIFLNEVMRVEDLQQLILMSLPNVAILGQDPLTVEELRRLLLLLLGSAVQCENKETFIQQIQSLDIETQAGIAGCIQQVTQDPRVVLPLQWEELVETEGADLQLVFSSMAKQIQSLLAQRDTQLERIAELCREREAQSDSTTGHLVGRNEESSQGLLLQLADSKAKLRRLKQQEDKGDQILDYKQEIETMEEQLQKLQKEQNRSLQGDVRGMRALRDELDCARERAARSEQLQTELQSCKHRLRSLELTRTQLKQKPLSVEVGEASTLRLLGAEQENAELRRRLEELQAQQEKNENATLKQRLEKLVTKLQQLEDKRKEEGMKMPDRVEEEGERKKVVRGIQGSESCRGEGEGRVKMMEEKEKRGEVIGTHREAGVGEEILHVQMGKDEPCNEVIQTNRRGEAEGGQKEREKQEKESEPKKEKIELPISSEIQKQSVEDKVETIATHLAVCSLTSPDMELLMKRLQEAQEEAERQTSVAQDLRSKLGEQSKKTWEAEQRLVLVEAELQRLKKAGESLVEARRQIEEEELCRLRSQAELHRLQTTIIATLEGERATLERERDTLRSSLDALRSAQRKSDQLELTTQTLRAELERQGRSLETSRRREEELEAELREATLEAESLARARDQALLEASRLEQEKEVCQSELDGQRKEGRQREREAGRLRQQLESTTLALEHSNQRACALDAEHKAVAAAEHEALLTRLSQSQEACKHLEEQLEALRRNSLSLQDSCTRLQTLNTQLQLQAHQKEWLASQAELLAQGSVLRAELNASQLERTRLEGELSALKETHQSLDLSNARLTSQYQKSNWIADRMKKLIKPRGGGGGREGRTLFTAAGSVENLADSAEFTSDTHAPQPSAPVSPSPLRKSASQTEPEVSLPGAPATRAGSGGRRKLGSRHGWGLGLARAGSGVSQSFSPGDQKTHPRQRLRSSQNNASVLWEGERGASQEADAPLTGQESAEEDEVK
uniref:Coiled-coil domain containing 88B n=1 Tax=Neolamprologus brichardi TaxID=32507 RepID=A0A3Q4M4J5_NEOBR